MSTFLEESERRRRYDVAVEAIYETAMAPEQWPSALQAVADVFGDVGGVLNYVRDDDRWGVIVSSGLMAGQDDYNRTWYKHDIRLEKFLEGNYFAKGHAVTEEDLGIEDLVDTHPFYTDFLAPLGLKWYVTMSISPDATIQAAFSVQRSNKKSAFTADEKATFVQLSRHAENALRLGMRLMDLERSNHALLDAFSRLDIGIFLLDRLDRVIFSNAAAEEIGGDGLRIVNGRLTARMSSEQAAIGDLLANANARADAIVGVKPTLIAGIGDAPALAIYILPVSTNAPAVEQFIGRANVLVLVIEMARGRPADPSVVRDLLGVTLGEARVAALIAAGLTPREISQQLKITEETARTVLKRVFQKAGISRQSELAALLGRAILGSAAPQRAPVEKNRLL